MIWTKSQIKEVQFTVKKKFYRIGKISRDLEISIKYIVEKSSLLGETISHNPNTKISEELFLKLKELIFKEKKDDKSSKKDVLGIKMNSLEQLKQLKEKINVDIEEQLIPANATIIRYGHKGFGYLIDNAETDYYFSFSDVLDLDLLNLLGDINQAEGTQVACKLYSIKGRLVATHIILPKKVKYLLLDIESYLANKDFERALHYSALILDYFPDFDPAIRLRKKVNYEKIKEEKEFDKLRYAYNLAKSS
ncbi:MAG: hypothetical protein HC905_00145 [Bacteroidales bacterium]|nr:hypothetical protein [Bacteroidales bacterium]